MKTSQLGLFETMRFYRGRTVYLAAHLQRLADSARQLKIKLPLPLAGLKKLILREIKSRGLKDAYLRLTIFRSPKKEFELLVKKYKPYPQSKYRQGFRVCLADLRQNQNSLFSRHKTTSRALYETAFEIIRQKGFDEALLLNQRGYLSEASRSNIFWIKGGELFTPGLSSGCLNGITRKAVIDLAGKFHLTVCQGKFLVSDLERSDEAFLTNSLIGIMPIAGVGKTKIGSVYFRPVTNFLREKYKSLV